MQTATFNNLSNFTFSNKQVPWHTTISSYHLPWKILLPILYVYIYITWHVITVYTVTKILRKIDFGAQDWKNISLDIFFFGDQEIIIESICTRRVFTFDFRKTKHKNPDIMIYWNITNKMKIMRSIYVMPDFCKLK